MSVSPGTKLGNYEILAPIGSGGMGAVYRARDTRPAMARDVAIKVLQATNTDAASRSRFEQEARATSALNHPNILAIYDVGAHDELLYLVEELVDGSTLRELLTKGPLSARSAVDYAHAIALGLAAAHAKRIIHRDLKPENVMVTSDGRVKILDFGLAKLHRPASTPDASTQTHQTGPGTILGTVAYMSPEQLRAQELDHRSDIFSLGVLLYEMLSGTRPFAGDTAVDTQAAILNAEPREFPPARGVPTGLERLVRRCLDKQPERRFQSASDLAFALESLTLSSSGISATAPDDLRAAPARSSMKPWHLAAAVAVSLAVGWSGGVLKKDETPTTPAPFTRLSVVPSPGMTIGGGPSGVSPARILSMSPDGRHLAFTAAVKDGPVRLWVRSLDNEESRELPGTDGASFPFWSQDGNSIAFYVPGTLKRVELLGGEPKTICVLQSNLTGGTWHGDAILFGQSAGGPIQRVPASGGQPAPVTTIDAERGETRHYSPSFLPDGDHFVFLAVGNKASATQIPSGLFVASLSQSTTKQLQPVGSNAQFAQGHLLFLDGQSLKAQRFDTSRLDFIGQPVTLADDVRIGGPAAVRGAFSVANDGTLAFLPGESEVETKLTWFDRAGNELGTLGEPSGFRSIALSPDGQRAAVDRQDGPTGNVDIWVYDLSANGARTRLTFSESEDVFPTWSTDGGQIYFSSWRTRPASIFAKRSNGIGEDAPFAAVPSISVAPIGWTPDGRTAVLSQTPNGAIFTLQVGVDTQPRASQLKTSEQGPKLSTDGRWIAYAAQDRGRSEVFVSPLQPDGSKWQISVGGGSFPRWRRDSSELYFLAPNGDLMVVPIDMKAAGFRALPPRKLFTARARTGFGTPYDVTPDGQRFLVSRAPEQIAAAPITIVQHWADHTPQ